MLFQYYHYFVKILGFFQPEPLYLEFERNSKILSFLFSRKLFIDSINPGPSAKHIIFLVSDSSVRILKSLSISHFKIRTCQRFV